MTRQLVLAALAALMLTMIGGCGNNPAVTGEVIYEGEEVEVEEANQTFLITFDNAGETGFRVILTDGTVYTDPSVYAQEMPSIVERALNEGFMIAFAFNGSIGVELDEVFGNGDADGLEGTTITEENGDYGQIEQPLWLPQGYNYTMSVRWRRWVGGCVSQWCSPGFALRLHRNGNQLWNMHGGTYRHNRRVCFGLYESESNWCRKWCAPNGQDVSRAIRNAYSAIRDNIYQSLLVVGVAGGTAWVIAQILAPVMVGALAFYGHFRAHPLGTCYYVCTGGSFF